MTPPLPAPPAGASGTVLVVEDDPAIREMVARALDDQGYRTLTAVDGASVAVAQSQQPDVILLDLLMPGMDGPAVSAALKANPATAAIPIVGMSTSSDVRRISAAMQADAVLAKPFELDDL